MVTYREALEDHLVDGGVPANKADDIVDIFVKRFGYVADLWDDEMPSGDSLLDGWKIEVQKLVPFFVEQLDNSGVYRNVFIEPE